MLKHLNGLQKSFSFSSPLFLWQNSLLQNTKTLFFSPKVLYSNPKSTLLCKEGSSAHLNPWSFFPNPQCACAFERTDCFKTIQDLAQTNLIHKIACQNENGLNAKYAVSISINTMQINTLLNCKPRQSFVQRFKKLKIITGYRTKKGKLRCSDERNNANASTSMYRVFLSAVPPYTCISHFSWVGARKKICVFIFSRSWTLKSKGRFTVYYDFIQGINKL